LDKTVFIIIVTYNGARWIDKNIPSLLLSRYPVKVIVVDNKSTDNTLELLEKYPEIDIVKSEINLGFGKANNIGMRRALDLGADYLFLLNQDAWIFEDTIGSLIYNMEQQDKLGILSPMHYAATMINLDQSFATYYNRRIGEKLGIANVPFVNAAAWMLSRNCVEKVGYFEPLFGHYGEDRNYCDRVLYHNFDIGIATHSKIVHDRVITRNFAKDVTQSKYKILATLLNPSYSLPSAYLKGLKEVFGLPKYFNKFYGIIKAFKMAGALSGYYAGFVFNPQPVKAARKNSL